jgi:hypothetical protein
VAEKGEVPKSFDDANPSVKEHAGSFWLKAAVVWKEHPCHVCAILTVLMLTALAFGLILGLASEDKLDRLPTTVRTGTVKLKDSSENNSVMIPYIINCTVTAVRAQSVVEETEDEIVVTNDDADPAELSGDVVSGDTCPTGKRIAMSRWQTKTCSGDCSSCSTPDGFFTHKPSCEYMDDKTYRFLKGEKCWGGPRHCQAGDITQVLCVDI